MTETVDIQRLYSIKHSFHSGSVCRKFSGSNPGRAEGPFLSLHAVPVVYPTVQRHACLGPLETLNCPSVRVCHRSIQYKPENSHILIYLFIFAIL